MAGETDLAHLPTGTEETDLLVTEAATDARREGTLAATQDQETETTAREECLTQETDPLATLNDDQLLHINSRYFITQTSIYLSKTIFSITNFDP